MSRAQPTEMTLEARKARAEQAVIKAARRVVADGFSSERLRADLRTAVFDLRHEARRLGVVRRANAKASKTARIRRRYWSKSS